MNETTHREAERLLRGIEMVELESSQTAVVAAHGTRPSRLDDELLLDPTAMADHTLDAALPAAVTAVGASYERAAPVLATRLLDRRRPIILWQRQDPHAFCLEAVAVEPVSNRGRAPVEVGGDLP